MRVWIDLANTPHVLLMAPVVARLREDGSEVLLTARDHAQTIELAAREWDDVEVIGGASPDSRLRKGAGILDRARQLRRFARARRPDVAFSHGSYAQVLAARAAGIAAVTMMDYEYQPANHLSFRLARRVVVPEAFSEAALRRCGAPPGKVIRYPGFKEQLYLGHPVAAGAARAELGVAPDDVLVVMRPAPEGALYHRMENDRFDGLLGEALSLDGVRVVVLPRRDEQRERYRRDFPAAIVPARAVDAVALLSAADVVIGAGGTMTREAAVLGTPTYTVFAGELAGVDAELIRRGLLHDLRDPDVKPAFERRARPEGPPRDESGPVLDAVLRALGA
jgi:predicted glycosyltransferase